MKPRRESGVSRMVGDGPMTRSDIAQDNRVYRIQGARTAAADHQWATVQKSPPEEVDFESLPAVVVDFCHVKSQ